MPGESEAGVLGVSLHQSLLLHGQLGSLMPGLGSHYLYCDNSDLSLTRLSARAFKATAPFLTVTVIEENCSFSLQTIIIIIRSLEPDRSDYDGLWSLPLVATRYQYQQQSPL